VAANLLQDEMENVDIGVRRIEELLRTDLGSLVCYVCILDKANLDPSVSHQFITGVMAYEVPCQARIDVDLLHSG